MAITVDPNRGSPVSTTGIALLPPVSSMNIPARPAASVAKNATSPELLIDTLSTDVRNEAGFVLGVIPAAVPVKTSTPPEFRKAAVAAVPALLMTGSRKPPKPRVFVSAMTLMP